MHRPHSGQALVLMLGLISGLLGAFVLAFNAGQLANDKIRLTNAADAAAYSAALWQARSLNYQAYLNRAIVANEVAIAQLVSLRSWSAYVDRLSTNAEIATMYIPPLAAPIRALSRGWDRVDAAVGRAAPVLEGALSIWNTQVLAAGQALAHTQAPLAAADLAREVAHANEPRARIVEATRLLQARNGREWLNRFTQRYQRGAGDLRRFTRLLMDSRDGFSRSRRADFPVPLPLVSLPRRGGTDLIGEYGWRGLDTWSVHIDLLLDHTEIPIGWGAAEQARQQVRHRGEHGGSLSRNPRASRLALAGMRRDGRYRGVPEIRDVANPAAPGPRSLTYSVALDLPAESIATADRLLMPSGLATIEGGSQSAAPSLSAGALHAIGSAEVYFQRPAARADARDEYPSLFNPYWQARLVATPVPDRLLAARSRGLDLDPFAVLP